MNRLIRRLDEISANVSEVIKDITTLMLTILYLSGYKMFWLCLLSERWDACNIIKSGAAGIWGSVVVSVIMEWDDYLTTNLDGAVPISNISPA